MNPKWQRCGRIAQGGVVLHLASTADGNLWAASPAGLFARGRGNWRPVTRGFPFGGTSTILAIRETLFVAGLPHGLVRSPDQGKTWHSCWTEQTEAPITCLVASPNFNRDRVVLAGTDGDGILRSTDGGRFWRLENFGLRSFSVLSMATAPAWGRHEILFAGTDAGVYQSPNGGRAWRQIGPELEDKKVISLIVSPHFGEDKTLYAGTESNGLYKSKDGGWSWIPYPLAPINPKNINCLWLASQDELLIGTGTDGILHTKSDGSSCEVAASIDSPVLCFTKTGDQFFAGTSEGELLSSSNGGETWVSDSSLSARRFNWLALANENTFLAAGLSEGVWISQDTGAQWEKGATGHEDIVPLDLAVGQFTFWMGTSNGVLASSGNGANWEQSFASTTPILAIACAQDRVWAGDGSGQILMSGDGGTTWQSLETPIGNLAISALSVSPHFAEDQTLVAAVIDEKGHQIRLWRSTDGGDHWQLWLHEKTDWLSVRISLSGVQGQHSALGLGTKLLTRAGEGWRTKEITTFEAPIAALLTTPDPQLIIAAVADELIASSDGETWESFSEGLEGASIVALQRSPDFANDRTIWGLSRDGEVWKRLVP